MDILRAHDGTKFPLSEVLFIRALERLRNEPYDALITYDDFAQALSLSPEKDERARRAVLRAGKTLLRECQKKIVCVRTVGYRIVKPNEQAAVSNTERARARRMMRRALQTVTYVHMADLTAEEMAKLLLEQARVGLQLAMCTRIERAKEIPTRQMLKIPPTQELLKFMTTKKTG